MFGVMKVLKKRDAADSWNLVVGHQQQDFVYFRLCLVDLAATKVINHILLNTNILSSESTDKIKAELRLIDKQKMRITCPRNI